MRKSLLYVLCFLTFSANLIAQHDTEHTNEQAVAETHEEKGIKEKISEYIQHHLQDSHDFVFFSDEEKGKHYGFSLPVILWDNGLQVFSSSKFHHGETIANHHGNHYKLYHNKIYKVDAAGTINYDEHHHPTNVKPLDFSITKGVLSIFILAALMLWLFVSIARSYTKNDGVPKGAAGFLEPIILYIRDEIAIPNIGEKHYGRYMNYLLTVFFFIWFFNLVGLTPLGINVTGNIAITFGLAMITFLLTQFTANKNYWKHIFWMPGVPVPMKIILAPIELLGVIIKPFALLIRLYANISAGHIVLMSLIGLMFIFNNWLGSTLSFFLAFAISLIELLVALLQAYIFTMLSALYFGFAVEEHDDH